MNITFKHSKESQRNMIHQWLKQDYIQLWIHGQGLQNTLNGLEKFYEYQNEGKVFDHEAKITQHWLGYHDNKPLVYLLTSNVFKNTDDTYAKYCELPGSAITLDIFIGDPEYVGKGLATTVIKEFLLSQFPTVSEVFIDPEQSNTRAIHVYQKVGFKIIDEYIAPWHPVPHYIMKVRMEALKSRYDHK